MQQENECDQCDDDHLFGQLTLQSVNCAVNQVRSVIGCDYFDTFWQTCFQGLDFLFYTVDGGKCILTEPHHNNSCNNFTFTVPFRYPTAEFGTDDNVGNLLHQDRVTVSVCAQSYLFDLVNNFLIGIALEVAQPTNEILGFGHFNQPSADILIRSLELHFQVLERDVQGGQLVRINDNLVLLDESADACNFSHTGYCLQLITHVPILNTAQFCKRMTVGFEHVLVNPAKSGSIRTETGSNSLWQTFRSLIQVFKNT
ncbi:hypothetical protein BMS3Bbin04_01812 [bacterium BMS3Bbin04]|nr:hypothetical protein BMS3Bbin04_01812 [bacterium BMS3Bbin04]